MTGGDIMATFVRASFIAVILFALTSCATTKSVTDGTPVSANHGVLVFHVNTKFSWAQLQYRKFSTNASFAYFFAEEITGPDGAFLNKAGETYWVKPIKAGEYMWSRLMVDSRYADFHGSNRFTIKPGTITYVGHLAIEETSGSAHIGVEDKEQDMRDYLSKNFPKYAQTMTLEKSVTSFRF
jgi:hypothetical protein